MTHHAFDLTAAKWIKQRDPAFVAAADQHITVGHDGEEYTAYFQMLGWDAEYPSLTGIICHDDEATALDMDAVVERFGAAVVALWTDECPAWGDDDHEAQAGYDAAKNGEV